MDAIWFDIVTPKFVLFLKDIIKKFRDFDYEILITARMSEGYTEVTELLALYGLKYFEIGSFGGEKLRNKLSTSIERQVALCELLRNFEVKALISGCSVDANRVAFGLGIPIVNFYDIPLSDHTTNFKKTLPQARLTIPLSTFIFHPFIVPKEIFLRLALEEDQIFSYNCIDPYVWLRNFKPDKDYIEKGLNIKLDKPLIVVREEEFKASYVNERYSLLYDGLMRLVKEIAADYVIIPRYESKPLKELFPFAIVLENASVIQHLLAHADLFIGGGGTINIEATYFGTPTISTRSFISHYDKYLIDKGLMAWVDNADMMVDVAIDILGKRKEKLAKSVYSTMSFDVEAIVNNILNLLELRGISLYEKSPLF
ncbi:MAG: DUF354 domain-containing protein [Nitrospirota bacterium]